ncbi:MAG: phosphotransferase, partial [Pseudomonas sp.]|nr:phosphotransferase [Pseudomonas sp.]
MALNDQSTQIRPGEELDASLIDPYLKAHIPGLSGSAKISQFPGGASNLTYLLEYPDQEFVLRRPPFGHKAKSAHDMGREFRILNQLKDGFPYCPKAYVHCTDESVIGAEFYVMERVKGIILRSDPPPVCRLLRRALRHPDRQFRLLLHLRPVPPGRHRAADLLPLLPWPDPGQTFCASHSHEQ